MCVMQAYRHLYVLASEPHYARPPDVHAQGKVDSSLVGASPLTEVSVVQAYRHLYVLASEPCCVRPVDVHTQGKVHSLPARASPLTPASVMQAYRHLYVLASEPRCVRPVDVHTQEPVCVPLTITLKQGQSSALQQPVAGKLLLLYFPCTTGLAKIAESSGYA